MSDEVKSAFYWRQNMGPLEPNGCRRSKVSVQLLSGTAKKLEAEGMAITQIAARLGITRRYVEKLLERNDS